VAVGVLLVIVVAPFLLVVPHTVTYRGDASSPSQGNCKNAMPLHAAGYYWGAKDGSGSSSNPYVEVRVSYWWWAHSIRGGTIVEANGSTHSANHFKPPLNLACPIQ
jgi:hypothetical protein